MVGCVNGWLLCYAACSLGAKDRQDGVHGLDSFQREESIDNVQSTLFFSYYKEDILTAKVERHAYSEGFMIECPSLKIKDKVSLPVRHLQHGHNASNDPECNHCIILKMIPR